MKSGTRTTGGKNIWSAAYHHLYSNIQGSYIYPEEINEVRTVPENNHKLKSLIISSFQVPPK